MPRDRQTEALALKFEQMIQQAVVSDYTDWHNWGGCHARG